MLEKVKGLAAERKHGGLKYDIGVDGGISKTTIREARAAGANVLVAGSSVFKSPTPGKKVEELRAEASKA